MLGLTVGAVGAVVAFAYNAYERVWPVSIGQSQALVCCNLLEATLPSLTSYPGQDEFEARQTRFYAGSQTTLVPACRVHPKDAFHLSTIMHVTAQNDCKFAVVSGGHMNWNASNIGSDGISIDLSSLNSINLSTDKAKLSVGSGNRWEAVYRYLKSHELIVVGGRASDVGVGGFLTGGGVSFLSFKHGWGASNILGYQLVLANGTVLEVNDETHPELRKALMFGSTNFGIITRFDLRTYPTGDIWSGARYHPGEDARPLLDGLARLTARLNDDPTGFNCVHLIWANTMNKYIIWSPIASISGPEPWPPVLKEYETIGTPFVDTMRSMDYVEATKEVMSSVRLGMRTLWFSLNIKVDPQLMDDFFEKGKEMFAPYLSTVPGAQWSLLAQPITTSMIRESKRRTEDFSGMDEVDGDQWLLLGSGMWDNAIDDDLMNGMVLQFQDWCATTAKERGKLVSFIYANYANQFQDVMGGYGEENVARLKEIQKKYDPDSLLSKHWRGGYRL